MNPNRVVQLVAAFIALACLAGAAGLSGPIQRDRDRLQLVPILGENKQVPHRVMLTQAALGSFRGLAVDLLWYRANQLKEAGQYREANRLSETICWLQPRFPRVWVFHAWNMAYNISVATHTEEERWNWVNKGVRLLRDQGIPANPDSVLLKKELAWIFFHKMGGLSDDMHWSYRKRLAFEWQEILGSTEGFTTAERIARMREVADAPDSLDALRQDEAGVRLLAVLTEMGYAPEDRPEELLRSLGRVLMFTLSQDAALLPASEQDMARFLDLRVLAVTRTEELVEPLHRLVPVLRKRVLRERYHMEPADMVAIMERYGPLDWRHPSAHSAYWSWQAVHTALQALEERKKDIDLLNTYRILIHSMQDLMRRGRLTFDPISGYLDMMPDARFVSSYELAVTDGRQLIDEFGRQVVDNFAEGHENFLLQAMMYSYMYVHDNERVQATIYYNRWRENFGGLERNRDLAAMSLRDLVWHEWQATMNQDDVRMLIDANLYKAFLEGLMQNRPDVSQQFYSFARRAYEDHHRGGVENPNAERNRMSLPPWRDLVVQTFVTIMRERRITPVMRARLWVRAIAMGLAVDGVPVPAAAYDLFRDGFTEEVRAMGLDPQRLLPEPPRLEEYRRIRAEGGGVNVPGVVPREPGTVQQQ